nr:uncharacterized protein LOC111985849 [Quercus suber]POE84816.1 hypothetical protein CFP56_75830 [Quercus suber]
MALVIEEIWMSRNLTQFSNIDPDAMKARQNIQTRFNEIVKVFFSVTQPPKELSSKNWSPPPSDCIKLNVDAATKSSSSTVAVVARNHLGKVLSIWAKKHHSSSPVIAEAESLYWAMNLAVKEGWKSVIFEGDAKNCFDPLINPNLSPKWLTHNIICNIRSLAVVFVFVNFCWVQRTCNSAAHEVAKFALNFDLDYCFNKGNLPQMLKAVSRDDSLGCIPISF